METKNLTIKAATITIKIIQVNNHKMTKATFRQIHETNKFDLLSVIGWVNDSGSFYALLNDNGKLKRSFLYGEHGAYDMLINGVIFTREEQRLRLSQVKKYADQLFIAT